MNDRLDARNAGDAGNTGATQDGNTISPLPGEPGIPNVAARPRGTMSKKGLLAVGLLILSLVAVSAISIQRFTSSGKKADDGESKRVSRRRRVATHSGPDSDGC
jgi:type IV secretion system protein VirB10